MEVIAPDPITGTTLTLLLGRFGQVIPRQYLRWSLRNGPYGNPHRPTELLQPVKPGE